MPISTPFEFGLFVSIPSKNTPPRLPITNPSIRWNSSQSDFTSMVAMKKAKSIPVKPIIKVARRARFNRLTFLFHLNLKCISLAYAVAAEFMLLLKLLIAAANIPAIKRPEIPDGNFVAIYQGNIASLF